MTVLVSAATRVGVTLEAWASLKDRRSVKMARCEMEYFAVARQLTADALGGEPTANAIDGAYRRWLTWADGRPEAMITIARYGRTTRPRPQRAVAMTVLCVVTIPTA